jgi:hypothetical protein
LYTGAVLGSVAAVAATFGSFFLRKAVVKDLYLFDPLVGTIEDVGAGMSLTESM